MKALLYRRGGLGDTLLTFPLLEILKRKGLHITAVGNCDYFKIARAVGWVDRILSEVPDEEFDLEIKVSFDGNVRPFPEGRVWILEHYLKATGLESEEFSLRLPVEPVDNSPFKGKAVIHPSSGSKKKNPDIELFLRVEEVLRNRDLDVIYLIGEADAWAKEQVSNYVESLDPLWIARSLKDALLYIGPDSGISHLASYVGVPSIVIYGPSDPVVWKPIGEKVYQLSLGLDCSPCFPNVCEGRECLNSEALLKSLLPLLDHLLVEIY